MAPVSISLHFVAFDLSAFLLVRIPRNLWSRLLLCVLLIGLAYGLESIEEQSLNPIGFECPDLAADSLGVLAALLLNRAGIAT
jgi:hypothetical protein